MAKRKSLTKKTRFEVFKRDKFTCQYCGQKAPDVVLQVDHIEPVSKGGGDDMLNYVTSCQSCNAGKGDRRLDDTETLNKKRFQLEDLQDRKEQLEMMCEWQKGLMDLDQQAVHAVADVWNEVVPGYSLNDSGLRSARKYLKTFNLQEVMEAVRIAADQYLDFSDGDTPTKDSVELAWSKVGAIARMERLKVEDPNIPKLYYIRGIIRNRFSYIDQALAIQLIKRASALGVSIETLTYCAQNTKNWSNWRDEMSELIEYFLNRKGRE